MESELKGNSRVEGAKKACGICDLRSASEDQGQFLKLKGICKESLFVDFDLDFYVHGTHDTRPFLKGIAYSFIAYNSTDERW